VEHAAPRVRFPAAQVQDRHHRRAEDRAATDWHDIGLHLRRNAPARWAFASLVGGGMGRTPVIATEFQAFVPWQQILVFIEAVVRVYNRYGRRDNMYKARIKILVKAEGQRFIDDRERRVRGPAVRRRPPHTITQASSTACPPASCARRHSNSPAAAATAAETDTDPAYGRWLQRNVHGTTRTATCAR
jgi:sulfite reductase (NADPH) hemoprotein beta-component